MENGRPEITKSASVEIGESTVRGEMREMPMQSIGTEHRPQQTDIYMYTCIGTCICVKLYKLQTK